MLRTTEWQYHQMFKQKECEMNEINPNSSPEATDAKQDLMLSRRAVLRGALLVGCNLIVPLAIFSSPANGAESAATKKVSKASVKYQNQPKGEQKCSLCKNFIAASKTCHRVEGPINPEGWCILWIKND
jgi:hypothetical protein